MSALENLRTIVAKGVAPDLFLALESLNLTNTVSKNAKAINELKLGRFFGSVQHLAQTNLVLMLTRIFERASNRNETRSIPAALKLLGHSGAQIPVHAPEEGSRFVPEVGPIRPASHGRASSEFTRAFADAFETRINALTVRDRLRFVRDKFVAHNEIAEIPVSHSVKFEEVDPLIGLALRFVAAVGHTYLSLTYVADGQENSLFFDAMRSSISLKRTLEALGIAAIPGWLERESDICFKF